jgi:hypothetical protein
MRHHNSPEELAKRSGEGDEALPKKGKEFRHYNHPEEVAKRAAAGRPGGVPIAPRRVFTTTGEAPPVWPPAGTVDNTAKVEVALVPSSKPVTEPPPARGDLETRLRRAELLLWTFVESRDEAREFRRLLNNQQAVTDGMASVGKRLNALENQIEAALAEALAEGDDEGDDDDDDDDAPALPPLEDDPGLDDETAEAPPVLDESGPPPTVPDNPPKGDT